MTDDKKDGADIRVATSDTVKAMGICVQAHVPTLVWGPPGSGKTKTAAAVARALERRLWTVILSVRLPEDQGGYPFHNRDKGYAEMVPTRWAKEVNDNGGGMVFLDELNTCPTPTQASALRVVDEGYVGDTKLHEATSFIGACMLHKPGSGTNPLISGMANRWAHFAWAPTPEEKLLARRANYPDPELPRIADRWEEGVHDANMLIASFHERVPALIHNEPDNVAERGGAWPSDRTWSMLAKLIAAARSAGFNEKTTVMRLLVQACVGEAARKEFIPWWVNLDLKDPEEYFADPKNTELPERQDKLLATLSGIAYASLKSKGGDEKWKTARQRTALDVFARVIDARGADLVIPATRIIMKNATTALLENLPDSFLKLSSLLLKTGLVTGAKKS